MKDFNNRQKMLDDNGRDKRPLNALEAFLLVVGIIVILITLAFNIDFEVYQLI